MFLESMARRSCARRYIKDNYLTRPVFPWMDYMNITTKYNVKLELITALHYPHNWGISKTQSDQIFVAKKAIFVVLHST